MKRLTALLTTITVVVALVVPAMAFAKGGPPPGKGPAAAPGQQKAAPGPERLSGAESDVADMKTTGDSAAMSGRERGQQRAAQAREQASVRKEARASGRLDGGAAASTGEPVDPGEADADIEDGARGPSEDGKRRGIANALSRIMANIERAEARVEAGNQPSVPAGLLKVMSRFFWWFGIDAGAEPGFDTPGSDEETSTPGPISDDDTSTVDPVDDE